MLAYGATILQHRSYTRLRVMQLDRKDVWILTDSGVRFQVDEEE